MAWLAGVWSSPLRTAGLALLVLGSLFFIYFLGSFILLPGTRVLTLAAETRSVTVTYLGANETLAVGDGARVCPNGTCPPELIEDAPVVEDAPVIEDALPLGNGERLEFRYLPQSGTVRVTILSNLREDELPAGTVIEIPSSVFASTGAQAFVGTIEVGELVQSRRNHYLVSGTYSFHQLDPIAWLIGREADELRTGTFLQGDRVVPVCTARRWYKFGNDAWKGCSDDTVWAGLARQTMFGHLTLGVDSDGDVDPALTLTATSDAGASALAIFRRGHSRPLLVETGLVELVQASPVFLTISAIMALVGGLLQTAGSLGEPRPSAATKLRGEIMRPHDVPPATPASRSPDIPAGAASGDNSPDG
jgi:hypothetical protein